MLYYIYYIITFVLGILAGTLSGLAPGIHINLVSAIILASSSFFLSLVSPLAVVIFFVAMAITHTFVDFIPSIFLGAPDEDDNALSILPGHQMLIKGEAYSAVILTLFGSISAIAIILILSPIFFYGLPLIYPYVQRIMPFILILACFFLVYFEKTSKIWAVIILLLSGFLGIATSNLPVNEPLLPLFTGLFGVSSLITSISKKQKIPAQKIIPIKKIFTPKKSYFKSLAASILASPFCSFLPGMGSGQAAVIGSEVIGDLNKKEFLILLGAINTIVTGLSFITLYTIGKARTGIAVAVGKTIELNTSILLWITLVIVLSGIAAFFISILLAKVFSKIISKINYQILSAFILSFLLAINFVFSGWLGILIVAVSACLGLLCIYAGIRRTHMMGCLLIPTILYYLL